MKVATHRLPDGSTIEIARAHRRPDLPQTGQHVGTGSLWVRLGDQWLRVRGARAKRDLLAWLVICETENDVRVALEVNG